MLPAATNKCGDGALFPTSDSSVLTPPMRIVFIGPPGAGKGTQSQRLKDYLKATHLSTGELLRDAGRKGTALGLEAAEFMKSGQLVPDSIVLQLVLDRLDDVCAQGCLFDGFPRTVPQAEALDKMLAERGMPLNVVLAMEVSEAKLVERLMVRGRPDDDQETIRERFRQHTRLTEPLLTYYRGRGVLRIIDAEGTPDEVSERIRKAVDAARG